MLGCLLHIPYIKYFRLEKARILMNFLVRADAKPFFRVIHKHGHRKNEKRKTTPNCKLLAPSSSVISSEIL